jgi:hypothetical protein
MNGNESNPVMDAVNALKELRKKWLDHVTELLNSNEAKRLPLVFNFSEPVQNDFITSPTQTMNVSCWVENSKKGPLCLVDIKPGERVYYYLNSFPLNKLSSITLHPDFVKLPEPENPMFKNEVEFEDYLRDLLSGIIDKVEIAFEFQIPVHISAWSLIPVDTYFITCGTERLKERHESEFRERVCLFQKKSSSTFYWPKYIPFKHLISVELRSKYVGPFKVVTTDRRTSIKRRDVKPFEYSPGVKTWDEIDISTLLVNPNRERTDYNCILCGRETPSPNNFVLLLNNGFVASTKDYPFKERIIGFKPIGSECTKKLGHSFVFSKGSIMKEDGTFEIVPTSELPEASDAN